MKLGIVFPQTEIGNDPIAIKDFAQALEGMGFRYILTYEHVLGADPNRAGWEGYRPYDYQDAFHEPFVLFGYLAGVTQSLEFATGILVLPQRQTQLVAKQAMQVDLLSDGRFRLGVAVGWNDAEFAGMGVDFHTRGRRIEEQVRLIRQLWSEPLVSFNGDFHQLDGLGINPRPSHHIPIWFGGYADVVLRRAAQLGDGWFPGGQPGDALQKQLDDLDEYLAAEGRSRAEFGIDGRFKLNNMPPAQWESEVRAWEAIGATYLAFSTMGMGLESPSAHLEFLRQLEPIVAEYNQKAA